MKTFFISISIASILFSCAKDNQLEQDSKIGKTEKELTDSLNNAYASGSATKLNRFLDNWNLEYKSNEDSVIREGGIAKDVYEIYKLVYKPFNINELGEHEWNNIYTGAKYVVVQDYIYYNSNYDSTNYYKGDSIGNFKPDVKFAGAKILYSNNKYSNAIYSFLNHGKEMNMMEKSDEETMNRARFLNKGIYIFPGHWGGYWHIITHPEISMVCFNADKTKARSYFRVVYMFGNAEFEKTDGKWKMVTTAITGIE